MFTGILTTNTISSYFPHIINYYSKKEQIILFFYSIYKYFILFPERIEFSNQPNDISVCLKKPIYYLKKQSIQKNDKLIF